MHVVSKCPVCKGEQFQPFLKCDDHTVSHETFQLVKCDACAFIVTSPRPPDSELGKYYLSDQYSSHTDKAKSFIDKIYKLSRVLTMRWKMNLVKENLTSLNSMRLLDYGCGVGIFLKTAKQHCFEVSGVEPSAIARSTAQKTTGQIIHEVLPESADEFDAITLWHVLEHIPDLNEKLNALQRALKKSGTMFIAVPNHLSPDAKTYGNLWAAYDVPRHLWHFNQDTMKQILSNHSLRIHKIIPMKLDAFYVSILSEKNSAANTSLLTILRGILNGIKSNYGRNKGEYSSLIYVIKK
jgi:2-polyprenyl-3-methyl-5-hydroxy-6-metoxy-1,4-benzoquinol methylase